MVLKVLKKTAVVFAVIMVLILPVCSGNQTVISIYRGHSEDGAPFYLSNMFPGDSQTNTYITQISHNGKITVHFGADIREGGEKLAEVLKCTVRIKGADTALYDGLMRDMPDSLEHSVDSSRAKTTKLTYLITVYLDTSVGNEYMNKSLVADFKWWAATEDDPDAPYNPSGSVIPVHPNHPEVSHNPDNPDDKAPDLPDEPDSPDESDEPNSPDFPGGDDPYNPDDTGSTESSDGSDDSDKEQNGIGTDDGGKDDSGIDKPSGELVYPPQTGDAHFCMWFYIAMVSLFLNIILLSPTRRRRNG